jgi:hypothetical protein
MKFNLEKILSPIKRIAGVGLLASCLALTAVSGCGNSTQAPGISETLQQEWPLWTFEDLEYNKYKGPTAGYDNTVNIKPDFYKGKIPFEYQSIFALGMGGPMQGVGKTLVYKFNDFSTYFIYNNFLLTGAVAVDNNNKMVAEAKIDFLALDQGQVYNPMIEVEEFHYNKGLLVFHCKSEFAKGAMGFKVKEFEQTGRKIKDYFVLLPAD